MTIVQPPVHVRVHVALTGQSPPAANVLFKMGQKRPPKTAAREREQWTKEWAGEGTATVPDTSEGMERQQPMTAGLQLFDQDSTASSLQPSLFAAWTVSRTLSAAVVVAPTCVTFA